MTGVLLIISLVYAFSTKLLVLLRWKAEIKKDNHSL